MIRDSDAGTASERYSKPVKKDLIEGFFALIEGPKTAHLYSNKGVWLDLCHPNDLNRIVKQYVKSMKVHKISATKAKFVKSYVNGFRNIK